MKDRFKDSGHDFLFISCNNFFTKKNALEDYMPKMRVIQNIYDK